jgi:hypothetical protein
VTQTTAAPGPGNNAPSTSVNTGMGNQNATGFGPITQIVQASSPTMTGNSPLDPPPALLPGLNGFYAALAASGFGFAVPPGVRL